MSSPRAGPLLLALFLLLALLPRPASAQEEGLFELRLTALPRTRTVVVVLDAQGQPLIPLRPVLEFLEIPTVERGDTLSLEWPPGAWSTRIDLATRTVRAGDAAYVVAPGEWLLREREVHLSVPALGRVLAGEASVDWENLTILLGGRADYPAVARANNAARREGERRAGGGALLRRAEPDVAYPARTGGVTAGWGVSGTWAEEGTLASARAALGMAVGGGALEGGATAFWGSRGDSRVADPYVQFSRAFPRTEWIRQVQLGDVLSDGLVTRPFFGVAAGNQPLYSPQFFGEALIRPVVPAGWEYEVYQGDYLVGVSTPGAGEPIAAPIGYGTTPVRVRLIGPAGQVRTEELVFLVPAVQVPPGEWRWAAGAGVCRDDACSRIGYLDVRRGVATNLTAGLGVDHTAVGDTARTRPYGILAYNPRPSLRTEVRARAGSLLHATVQRYQGVGGWLLSGGWRRDDDASPGALGVYFAEGSATWRIPALSRTHPLSLQARLRGSEWGRVDAWQTTAVTGVGRVRLAASYESGFQARDVASVQAYTFAARRLLRLRDVNVNARLDVAGGRFESLALGTTFRPSEASSVTAGVVTYGDGRPPGLALAMVTRTPSAYLQASSFRERARSGAFASATGGIAWDPRVGALASPFETLGRGGVSGTVFFDEDGDGLRDPGEPTAAGIPVVVGGERAVSDDAGRYRAWGLLPYAVLNLAVDTLNVADTELAPARPEYLLRPAPNLYTPRDLPVLRTREASGRVRWRGRPGPLGGIGVEALREGETEPLRAATFSDGEFYFSRLPAGRYTLTISATSLRALGAATEPETLRFEVSGAGRDLSVTLPPLWLVRPGESAAPSASPPSSAATPRR
ncbi:MAG TPA: carboxypeptidase-like regulatory domain-containing protein [Longimicrobium sp.]|nr:carboxypeptidase-like regulatory domain-containing protein [Longimicrobium sp.]